MTKLKEEIKKILIEQINNMCYCRCYDGVHLDLEIDEVEVNIVVDLIIEEI